MPGARLVCALSQSISLCHHITVLPRAHHLIYLSISRVPIICLRAVHLSRNIDVASVIFVLHQHPRNVDNTRAAFRYATHFFLRFFSFLSHQRVTYGEVTHDVVTQSLRPSGSIRSEAAGGWVEGHERTLSLRCDWVYAGMSTFKRLSERLRLPRMRL